jgi:PHD/YefM family antitoxin component YafN of YafNO toxin-antitoxin module
MDGRVTITVKEVSATRLRDRFRLYTKEAKGKKVILIRNRRQESKYLVDKEWFDRMIREHESLLATLEVLANPELTERLLRLGKTIDDDVKAGRLHSMEEVFGEN